MRYLSVLVLLLLACNSKPNPNGLTADEAKSLISKNERTILYFWTSWCGPSRVVLQRAYRPLIDTIQSGNLPFKVLLIYSSGEQPIDIPGFDASEFYTLKYPGTGTGIIDRMRIRHFLEDLLGEEKAKLVTGGKFSFGVPVDVMVDKELNIVDVNLPQHKEYLLKILSGELPGNLSTK